MTAKNFKQIKFMCCGLIIGFILGCASRSVLPEVGEIKVSREVPHANKKCKDRGPIRGTTMSTKGTAQEALNDLKQEAANKGANYIVVQQYSDQQTSVTGWAYECP